MTYKEKLKIEHPDCINVNSPGGCKGCLSDYGYLTDHECAANCRGSVDCVNCWDREIPEPKEKTCYIRYSGNRREFETGAVRDICEGKGRCDLMPLDVVADYMIYNGISGKGVFENIHMFQKKPEIANIYMKSLTHLCMRINL